MGVMFSAIYLTVAFTVATQICKITYISWSSRLVCKLSPKQFAWWTILLDHTLCLTHWYWEGLGFKSKWRQDRSSRQSRKHCKPCNKWVMEFGNTRHDFLKCSCCVEKKIHHRHSCISRHALMHMCLQARTWPIPRTILVSCPSNLCLLTSAVWQCSSHVLQHSPWMYFDMVTT